MAISTVFVGGDSACGNIVFNMAIVYLHEIFSFSIFLIIMLSCDDELIRKFVQLVQLSSFSLTLS